MSDQPSYSTTNSGSQFQPLLHPPAPLSQGDDSSTVAHRASPVPRTRSKRSKSSKKKHKAKATSPVDLIGIGSQFDNATGSKSNADKSN
ncbi:hypothetical protein DL766_003193 [Monosporascus sp. MC13-8B]|uniref:Uncharacterized protein n=1 Tax=Monosporascus cannonballus TaxID=155416 RepID=A0ABY0HEY2_9PEZI|nr:hypothetical protein DL762_002066 [Monosporascus cannonballus]RYO92167.1 hypothetical protein DL763_004782 [Monosporascus cannonballus]RYP34007.1 hypothetical protein DL766_003193 [Monosporascus sp. MC13-8B]